jgi:replication initiation and membrane attachment protein DnaB
MKIVKITSRKKSDSDLVEIRDSRTHFTVVDDLFIDVYARLVGVSALGVYVILCRHAGVDRSCWPSVVLIADKLDIGLSTVKRSIRILESFRILKVDRPRGSHNVYHLLDKEKWKKESGYYKTGGCRVATKSERSVCKAGYVE